jgi:oligosaccharide repeat unit polymerase
LVIRMGIPVLSAGAAEDRLRVNNFGPTQSVFLCAAWTMMVFLPASYWMGRLGKKLTVAGVVVVSALLLSMGGRGNFFIGGLTLLIAGNYLRRRLRIRTLILLATGLFAGLSAYGFLRDSAFRDADSFTYLEQIGIPVPVQPLVYGFIYMRGTVATFRDVTEIIPSEIPYQHGRLTLLPLSTLLPGHHEMADLFFKNILGHDFIGLGQPATPLGPLYGDFGGCGIVAGMFAFGTLAGALYRRMRQRPAIVTALVYAWVMQTGLLGLFASLFPYITALFIPLLWLALDRLLSSQGPGMRSRLVVPFGVVSCPPTL